MKNLNLSHTRNDATVKLIRLFWVHLNLGICRLATILKLTAYSMTPAKFTRCSTDS